MVIGYGNGMIAMAVIQNLLNFGYFSAAVGAVNGEIIITSH